MVSPTLPSACQHRNRSFTLSAKSSQCGSKLKKQTVSVSLSHWEHWQWVWSLSTGFGWSKAWMLKHNIFGSFILWVKTPTDSIPASLLIGLNYILTYNTVLKVSCWNHFNPLKCYFNPIKVTVSPKSEHSVIIHSYVDPNLCTVIFFHGTHNMVHIFVQPLSHLSRMAKNIIKSPYEFNMTYALSAFSFLLPFYTFLWGN